MEIEKQLMYWIGMYQQLNKSLKNAGDLAHYANFIQDQICQLSFTINPDNIDKLYESKLK